MGALMSLTDLYAAYEFADAQRSKPGPSVGMPATLVASWCQPLRMVGPWLSPPLRWTSQRHAGSWPVVPQPGPSASLGTVAEATGLSRYVIRKLSESIDVETASKAAKAGGGGTTHTAEVCVEVVRGRPHGAGAPPPGTPAQACRCSS